MTTNKNYHFSFMFHEANTLIPLEFSTYQEALDDAKFYSQVFIEAAWRNASADKNFENIYNEFLKLVGEFRLEPNETNFDFYEYFQEYYKFYSFKKELDGTWQGMFV
jgi:hypothetical protein